MGEPEKRDDFNHGPSFVTMVQSVAQLSMLSKPDLPVDAEASSTKTSLRNIGEDLRQHCGHSLRDLADIYHKHHHHLLPYMPPNAREEIVDAATSLEQAPAAGVMTDPMPELLLCLTACLGALNIAESRASRSVIRCLAQRITI